MGAGHSTEFERELERALHKAPGVARFPDDLFYHFEYVKPYNLDVPVNPAAVTYPRTVEQVSTIVEFAATHNFKVQARSGGHSYGNYCVGGANSATTICVDLKYFQQFSYDKATGYATIGAGTLLGDVTKRLYSADKPPRAMAHGICPQVGSGGHFTIGGFGPASRMWGTALDHVLSAQVVLADGSVITASDDDNKEIFFAIKGAAASFGIVTEFVVRTQAAPPGGIRYSFSVELGSFTSMAQTFKNWQKVISNPNLDEKLYSQLSLSTIGLVVSGVYYGSEEDFKKTGIEEVFPPQTKRRVLVFDNWLGTVVNWLEDVGLHLGGGVSTAFYCKSLTFEKDNLMTDGAIDKLFKYLDDTSKGTLIWFIIFEGQGGFTNTIPRADYAFAHRNTVYYLDSYGIDIGQVNKTTRGFVQGVHDTIIDNMPKRDWGAYPGYVDPALPNAQEAYWGSNLPRLEQLKLKYDKYDVFHNPQSVRPAAANLGDAEAEQTNGRL